MKTYAKALLVDPFEATVTPHTIELNNNDEIYKLGHYECFDIVHLPNDDMVFVDDEGLFEGRQEISPGVKRGFIIYDSQTLKPLTPHLVGRGVVLGFNPQNGKTTSAHSERIYVKFFSGYVE